MKVTASANFNDLTGKRFGDLFVLNREGTAKNRTPLWQCGCVCGNFKVIRANHLMHNHTTSCGCFQRKRVKEAAPSKLINKKFGRLLVIEKLNKRKNRAVVWKCLCDCGNFVEVTTASLKIGHTKSCGCFHFDSVWRGGISCEPYCVDWSFKEFKDMIKERDGFKCLNPDCWRTTERLAIHHVDYNKKNCNVNNLITVCTSCNTRANTNRVWHKHWYQAILHKRYNYIY